nr:hypothetical protein [Marinimicrobium sp. ABcell2]
MRDTDYTWNRFQGRNIPLNHMLPGATGGAFPGFNYCRLMVGKARRPGYVVNPLLDEEQGVADDGDTQR